MKRRVYLLALGVSLAVLAFLCCGYAGSFGLMQQCNAPSASPAFYRETTFTLDGGRFVIWKQSWNSPPQGKIPVGRTVKWVGSVIPRRLPQIDHALAGFDAHAIPPAYTKGSNVYLIACPIWLLAIPFCVAPAIYILKWRKRRKRDAKEIQGFPIVAPAELDAPQ